MLDRICQYSTIIFAGNVTVLIMVAVATDYWEYRAFRYDDLVSHVKSNRTQLLKPHDTDTYVVLRYFWDMRAKERPLSNYCGNETYFQPPAVLHRYSYSRLSAINKSVQYNDTHNETVLTTVNRTEKYEDTMIMFVQYGNLFRDCSNLEVGVLERLGMTSVWKQRCNNFIIAARPPDDYVKLEIPAIVPLEQIAFLLAAVSIVSSIVSLLSGAVGSIKHDRKSILLASASALISGLTLTFAIAMFHGKCYLLRRREIMDGIEFPFKDVINHHRVYRYGWSFVLAWTCVALCYIHTWVWLSKAQSIKRKIDKRKRARVPLDRHLLQEYSSDVS